MKYGAPGALRRVSRKTAKLLSSFVTAKGAVSLPLFVCSISEREVAVNALEQKANFELREYEGMQFPYTQDTTILGAPVPISDSRVVLKNSISTHHMEAVDCNEDGNP